VELLGQGFAFDADFIGYLAQRGIQAHARFYADQHQIGGIGKVLEDLALAARGHPAQNQIGQVAGHKSGHQGKNNSWVLSALLAASMSEYTASPKQEAAAF
jgi:hypothetical protein